MSKNNLFKSMFALLFAFAAVAFVGCKDDIEDVQAPVLTVSPAILNFDELGGSETVELSANCDWSIGETPSWVDIQPMSGSGNTTLTVTTYPKNENQKHVVYFTLYHSEYGEWGKSKSTLTINQTYGGEPIVEDIFYYNDFDKEAATKTYGSGESWPYLDQFEGWKNQTGTGVENVTYSFKGMSARNNSNSNSEYSDYAGSGVNNMFFGSGAYLQIEKIAISSTNVNLSFVGEKYLNGSDNLFMPEEFTITLSADGQNWSAPISYSQPEGAGRWNLGEADFTLPEGTTTLWVKFAASVASAYRIDDVKLMAGYGGQQITFDGGSVTPPTPGPGPQPTDAIYSNDFDMEAATKTYGSGSSWPYLDQFEGWKNETGTGAKNVTYDFKGVSARDNSNSNSEYSDYAGSGVNNIFFGSSAYFTIGNIALNTNKLNLTFGGEKYLQGADNTFSTTEFTITLSADGQNWSAPIAYTAPAGQGRWNVGSADFTLPEGISTLYIKFEASVASAYRIDDVKLSAGEGGQEVNLEGGETPTPTPDPTPGEVTTIAEVLALGQGATIQSAVIEATVISNMDLNNLTSKKGLYVQDATAGLQFYLAANHELKFGDKVKIDLSGAQIADYNGAVQISGLALEKITTLSSGNAVEAKTVTMADFLANKYEGQYVAIEGVQVASADLAKTWVMDGSHTSITIEDANGNSFAIFSSKYATYGTQTVAQGSGTIKGISSISKGAMQLIFAQQSDYAGLTGARFEGGTVTPDPTPGEVVKATVQEFLNAAEDDTIYELTGEITSVDNTSYGNFYLKDSTAEVYIYGLCSPTGEQKYWATSGVKVGDTITVQTVRTSHNGTPQGKNAIYVSHTPGEDGGDDTPVDPDATVAKMTFSEQGFADAESVDGVEIALDDVVTILFAQGTANNAPAYYDSGSAIRMYQNGSTLDVKAEGKTITSIELTFANSQYYLGADSGKLSEEGAVRTWTGEASAVKFTATGTDKNHRAYVSAIKVTYK